MTLQKKVNEKLAFGVHGDLYDANSPRRIDPKTVAGGAIGLFYTIDPTDPKKVVLGGTGVLAGVAVNTKEYITNGLVPSLAFRSGDVAQIMSMGRVVLKVSTPVTVGMSAYYNTTTGEITADDPATVTEGLVEIPNSIFIETNSLADELAVLQLG